MIVPITENISIREGITQTVQTGYDESGNMFLVNQLVNGAGGIALTDFVDGVVNQTIAFSANAFAFQNGLVNNITTWSNLQTKVLAIGAVSSASNSTTLNVNNTIVIENGETLEPPTSFISLSCADDVLQLNINGDVGLSSGLVLTSGGLLGSMYWGTGGGGSVGSLQDVINIDYTLQGVLPSLGQIIGFDGVNVVWGNFGKPLYGSDIIDPSSNMGTINFGITYPSIPFVVISQLTAGILCVLSITDITVSGFSWVSSSIGVNIIQWSSSN